MTNSRFVVTIRCDGNLSPLQVTLDLLDNDGAVEHYYTADASGMALDEWLGAQAVAERVAEYLAPRLPFG